MPATEVCIVPRRRALSCGGSPRASTSRMGRTVELNVTAGFPGARAAKERNMQTQEPTVFQAMRPLARKTFGVRR